MKKIVLLFFLVALTRIHTFSQPTAFLNLLPSHAQQPMAEFVTLIVDGQMWAQPTAPSRSIELVADLFATVNPRDGEWGIFDEAIGKNSRAAHQFFDTLEISLSLNVKTKGSTSDADALVDFDKPKGSGDKTYILINAKGQSVEAKLKDVLALQLIVRRVRGLHSVLS